LTTNLPVLPYAYIDVTVDVYIDVIYIVTGAASRSHAMPRGRGSFAPRFSSCRASAYCKLYNRPRVGRQKVFSRQQIYRLYAGSPLRFTRSKLISDFQLFPQLGHSEKYVQKL
jgi:hypothetical protein